MQAPTRRASAWAAASARARARPAAAAARARSRARASPSTASRAARCRSTSACRSAASTNIFAKEFNIVSLSRIQDCDRCQEARRQGDGQRAALIKAGVIRRAKDGVRLLADGELKAKLTFEVAGASKAAVETIRRPGARSSCLRRQPPSRASPTKRRPHGRRLHLEEPGPISGFRRHAGRARLSGVFLHGVGSRTACHEPQFFGLRQGEGPEAAHLVHARRAARLSARHLHPGARHRPRRLCAGLPAAERRRAGMFNMFAGGAVQRMAIFALGIMPYITASIIMQVMTTASPRSRR